MEKKKRKNRKPLIVVAMLLMVALVVGMGAMTYSRYVSSFNSGEQTATAAKWGFVVNANTTKLFGTQYGEDNTDNKATVDETGNIVVKASADGKVVAPGTTGSMTFSISGTAEVRAQLTVDVTVISEIAYGSYLPIKWTLTTGGTPVGTANNTSLADVLSSLETTPVPIAPGTSIATGGDYVLTWEWAWSDVESDNINDTIIGIASTGTYDDTTKSIRLADGSTFGEVVTTQGAFDAIETTLAFELSIKLEQIQ